MTDERAPEARAADEDAEDLAAAEAAKGEPTIPWETVKEQMAHKQGYAQALEDVRGIARMFRDEGDSIGSAAVFGAVSQVIEARATGEK